MSKPITIFLLLFSAWLCWSGGYSVPGSEHFHPLLLVLGLLSCGAITVFYLHMERGHPDSPTYHFGAPTLAYVPWILWEIAKSNVKTARIILSPGLPISPRLIRLRTSQCSDLGRVFLANSITLTPGTLTLDVRPHEILVHALTEADALALATGEMDRRVSGLERPDR